MFGSNAPFKTCRKGTESCSFNTFNFLGLSFALFIFVAISLNKGGTALPDSDSAAIPRLVVNAGWDCCVACSSMIEPSGFLLIIMLFSLTVLLKSKIRQ